MDLRSSGPDSERAPEATTHMVAMPGFMVAVCSSQAPALGIRYGQQPANQGDALLGLTSNSQKGVTWLRLILQLPFAFSLQVIKHFRLLMSQFFVHTL